MGHHNPPDTWRGAASSCMAWGAAVLSLVAMMFVTNMQTLAVRDAATRQKGLQHGSYGHPIDLDQRVGLERGLDLRQISFQQRAEVL